MDFFQFLQNSTNNSPKKNLKRKNKITENNDNQENLLIQENTLQIPLQNEHETRDTQRYDILNIKRGDYVKIIGLPNSNLNSYKGYIGEIKDYKQDQDFALVFLHGITALSIIKFPLKHLIKCNYL